MKLNRIKNLLSIILLCTFLCTQISVISVSAEESLEITGFSATANSIVLNFSQAVDSTALAGEISLASDEEEVSLNAPVFNEDNTEAVYTVSSKLKLNTKYIITVSQGFGDGSYVLNEEYIKGFKLSPVFEDDFSGYDETNTVNSAYRATNQNGGEGTNNRMSLTDGRLYITPSATTTYTPASVSLADMKKWDDINMELTGVTADGNADLYMDLRSPYACGFYGRDTYMRGDVRVIYKTDTGVMNTTVRPLKTGSSYKQTADISNNFDLTVSLKGNNIKLYANRDLIQSVTDAEFPTAGITDFSLVSGAVSFSGISFYRVSEISTVKRTPMQMKRWYADCEGVRVYFDKPVNEANITGEIGIYKDGEKLAGKLTSNENHITITTNEKLERDTEYTLSINKGFGDDLYELDEDKEINFIIQTILEDDFEKNSLTNSKEEYNKWYSNSVGYCMIENGEMAFKGHGGYLYPKTWQETSYEDITLYYDLITNTSQVYGGGDGVNMFVFMRSQGNGYFNTDKYVITLRGSMEVPIRKISGTDTTVLTQAKIGVRGVHNTHKMKASMSGNHLRIDFDGALWQEYYDDEPLAAGNIGFQGVYGHIDNVIITRPALAGKVEYELPSDENYMETDKDITVKFGNDMDVSTIDENGILVKKNGIKIKNYTVSAADDKRTVTIHFTEPLEFDTEYTVSVADSVKVENSDEICGYKEQKFRTMPAAFEYKSFTVKDGDSVIESMSEITSGNITANAVIKNNYLAETRDCLVTIALYEKTGNKLLAVNGGRYELSEGQNAEVNAAFTVSPENKDNMYIKCFVWTPYDKNINSGFTQQYIWEFN